MNRQGIAATAFALSVIAAAPAAAAPPTVEMTWMSIANWYFKIGDKRIVMDGYITRVPQNLFVASPVFPKDMYTFTKGPYGVDVPAITRVKNATLGTDKLDLLLAGHAHFDHTWDTPAWSRLTGAPMMGSLSACLQANTQGVMGDSCRIVSGGVDQRVTVWDAQLGQELQTFKGHTQAVNTVAFSADGERILSGSGAGFNESGVLVPGELKVWDAKKGQAVPNR